MHYIKCNLKSYKTISLPSSQIHLYSLVFNRSCRCREMMLTTPLNMWQSHKPPGREVVPGTKSFNWSRRLACATRGGGRSEVGHCFHLLFLVQACLRAPAVVVDEAKMAIVFTYFLVHPWSEADHCFGSSSLRAPPVVADESKLAIVFGYCFFNEIVQTAQKHG